MTQNQLLLMGKKEIKHPEKPWGGVGGKRDGQEKGRGRDTYLSSGFKYQFPR